MNVNDFLNSKKIIDHTNNQNNGDYQINKVTSKEDFISLYLSDNSQEKYRLKVTYDDYLTYSLSPKTWIDENLFEKLKKKENYILAYSGALRRLAIKDYSIYKLKESLKQKYELSPNVLNEIIDKLISLNYLDDERYVQSKLSILSDSSYSKRMIYQKLLKDGINKSLIDKYYVDKSESSIAIIKAEKYKKSIINKSVNQTKLTIQNKLLNDGFNLEDIKIAISKLDFKDELNDEVSKCQNQASKLLSKYSKKYSGYELKNKIYQALMQKGYKSDDINKTLSEMEDL